MLGEGKAASGTPQPAASHQPPAALSPKLLLGSGIHWPAHQLASRHLIPTSSSPFPKLWEGQGRFKEGHRPSLHPHAYGPVYIHSSELPERRGKQRYGKGMGESVIAHHSNPVRLTQLVILACSFQQQVIWFTSMLFHGPSLVGGEFQKALQSEALWWLWDGLSLPGEEMPWGRKMEGKCLEWEAKKALSAAWETSACIPCSHRMEGTELGAFTYHLHALFP